MSNTCLGAVLDAVRSMCWYASYREGLQEGAVHAGGGGALIQTRGGCGTAAALRLQPPHPRHYLMSVDMEPSMTMKFLVPLVFTPACGTGNEEEGGEGGRERMSMRGGGAHEIPSRFHPRPPGPSIPAGIFFWSGPPCPPTLRAPSRYARSAHKTHRPCCTLKAHTYQRPRPTPRPFPPFPPGPTCNCVDQRAA